MAIRLLLILPLVAFLGCQQPRVAPLSITGETMGTTYHITVPPGHDQAALKAEIDAHLEAINASLSTYLPTSLISSLNEATDVPSTISLDPHFVRVLEAARSVYGASEGAFNPAVGPLVNAWGFGATLQLKTTEHELSELVELVDFDSFTYDAEAQTLTKTLAGSQLDFSAIAKGYAVDEVAQLLQQANINSYFVEIGGELVTKGQHPEGRPWRAGITQPTEDASGGQFQSVVSLSDAALATSGNYRNFYEVDGERYTHTINPTTGRPERSSLLSATVVAPSCMLADGYATAFMVLGWEKTKTLVEQTPGIEAYLIGAGENGFQEWASTGFPPHEAAE